MFADKPEEGGALEKTQDQGISLPSEVQASSDSQGRFDKAAANTSSEFNKVTRPNAAGLEKI
jgi:hypothetical protein